MFNFNIIEEENLSIIEETNENALEIENKSEDTLLIKNNEKKEKDNFEMQYQKILKFYFYFI